MIQRVKWTSKVKKTEAKKYESEIAKVIKKDLIEKGVEYKKSRYIVTNGQKQTVTQEVQGKPSVIKETIIREDSPYEEQTPEIFNNVEFDCLESELQDYGTVKYYRSDVYGKIRVSSNAVYYEVDG
tara:strand:+ start:191 stop:568 length:378 start_codon:yes stop_codon:yes gene_type:complete